MCFRGIDGNCCPRTSNFVHGTVENKALCDLMIENRPLVSFCGVTVIISFHYSRYFCEIPFLRGIWKISFDINGYRAFVANSGFIFSV